MKNNSTAEILDRASQLLDSLSKEELMKRTSEAGINLSENIADFISDDFFVFDLKGCFPEVANARSRWFPEELLKRKSINVKSKTKSRRNAALCFYN